MKKLVLLITVLLAFMLAIQLVSAFGLSVMPADIKMNVIRGQQLNLSISVYNPGNEEVTYSIKADDKIANWVSFYIENQSTEINKITVPPTSFNKFIVNFKIPKDIPNGKYLSTINVGSSIEGIGSDNASSLAVSVPISVSLQVEGSQFLTGKVINITTTDTEINRLLRIKTEFQNTGDVVATPKIEVAVKKNGVEIANFVHSTTSVEIDNTSIIITEWDTTGQTVGDYVANVKVYLDTSLIKEQDLSFKILDRGTLTASGKIIDTNSPKTADSGSVSKIEAEFMNTGEIDVKAKISGEIYLDNKFIDTLEGDESLVNVGKTETLTAYFKPAKEGAYLIKSNVVYEGKKEPLSDISINVGSSATGMAVTSSGIFDLLSNNILIIVIVIIVAIIIIIYFKKIRETY